MFDLLCGPLRCHTAMKEIAVLQTFLCDEEVCSSAISEESEPYCKLNAGPETI